MDSPRSATDFDREIGSRIRLARKAVKMSQTGLADKVGVTFQQIQKYERGTNRVAASRLVQLATVLQKPIGFFLGDETAISATDNELLSPLRNLSMEDAKNVLSALDETDSKKRKNLIDLISSI